jgi:hypothetical protein
VEVEMIPAILARQVSRPIEAAGAFTLPSGAADMTDEYSRKMGKTAANFHPGQPEKEICLDPTFG